MGPLCLTCVWVCVRVCVCRHPEDAVTEVQKSHSHCELRESPHPLPPGEMRHTWATYWHFTSHHCSQQDGETQAVLHHKFIMKALVNINNLTVICYVICISHAWLFYVHPDFSSLYIKRWWWFLGSGILFAALFWPPESSTSTSSSRKPKDWLPVSARAGGHSSELCQFAL